MRDALIALGMTAVAIGTGCIIGYLLFRWVTR
jgi:hypothetical protein